jgi:hypothetical protein
MRLASTALKTFLDNWPTSQRVMIADLYIFTLITGETFYYSGFQTPLVAPLPNTTAPTYEFVLGPRFARTKSKVEVGPQVDELSIDLYAGDEDILAVNSGGTITWQNAFFVGLFDGAYCELLRAFLTGSPPHVVGTITWFYGRVGDVDIGRTKTAIRVKSLLDLLTVQMPRRLFQSACNHVFGEPGFGMCGYDRVNGLNALGTATGIGLAEFICGVGSDQNSIKTTFTPAIATSYDNGTIQGFTGLNAGFTRTIGKIIPGSPWNTVYFLKPWIFPVVESSDYFHVFPGCDHTLNTCTNTFQNRARYGGFPYIPPPETAI